MLYIKKLNNYNNRFINFSFIIGSRIVLAHYIKAALKFWLDILQRETI